MDAPERKDSDFPPEKEALACLKLIKNETQLMTVTTSGIVTITNVFNYKIIKLLRIPVQPAKADVSLDGKKIAIVDNRHGRIVIYNLENADITQVNIDAHFNAFQILLTSSQRYVVLLGEWGMLVWDLKRSKTKIHAMLTSFDINHVLTLNGKDKLITYGDHLFMQWDILTASHSVIVNTRSKHVKAFCIDRQNTILAYATKGGNIHVYDMIRRKELRKLSTIYSDINGISMVSDSRCLLFRCSEALKLWNLETGECYIINDDSALISYSFVMDYKLTFLAVVKTRNELLFCYFLHGYDFEVESKDSEAII